MAKLLGVVDPIENWSLMSVPRAIFTSQEVRATAARGRGRLSTMISEAEEAAESATPGFAPSELHEVIWTAAAAHWTPHQYRVAVREASEALTVHWKERLGRNDVTDTSFWQQTLSGGDPEPGKPKLVWPGPAEDQTAKSMRGGLAPLAGALNNLATGLIGEICLDARVRFGLDPKDVEDLLRRSLYLDSGLDHQTLKALLDLALPPSAQSPDGR